MIASPNKQLTLDQRCFLFICTEGSLSWVWKIWREANAGKPEEEAFCVAGLTSSVFDERGYSMVEDAGLGLKDQRPEVSPSSRNTQRLFSIDGFIIHLSHFQFLINPILLPHTQGERAHCYESQLSL